jgi:hypothetical protein
VSEWINEVRGERLIAERELAAAPPSGAVSAKAARAMVKDLGDVRSVLTGADPKLKAQLYDELGISVRYAPSDRLVSACATVRVGGGT